jgi:hypothetical protein
MAEASAQEFDPNPRITLRKALNTSGAADFRKIRAGILHVPPRTDKVFPARSRRP